MAISNEKLLEQLSSISLLPTNELSTIRQQLTAEQLHADAEQLAKELVKSGKLTKFQAAALYQGKGKGLVFGEYVVLDKLGAGGMGQVFKAHHRRMKRLAAVKVLPPHIMKDPQAVQRFYQEVEMAAKLSHQNIVAAYDAAESNGLHYLVMEFVDGRDLSSLLQKQGPLNVDQVMNVIRQAAEGLAYAHSQGVVHRDIKPGNLLVDKAGIVKILDMGLARTVDALEQQDKSSKQELTQAGQVMGTVDYMAPEQARDARTADHRADLYSLGCTMYRLLTGYVPFPADTMVKKLMAHAQQPVPSLKKHCPEATPQLEELFRRMLEKDPAKRIGSAKEVAETLKKLLSGADEERSSVSVLDDPEQAEEWQGFLKSSASSVSGIGKAAGSTVGKAGESAIGKSNVGKRGGSTIGKQGGSVIGKKEASVSEVVSATPQNNKLLLYGGIGVAAIVLLSLGGWLALRGGAEQEPLPANTVAAVPTPSKPTAPMIAFPTASAKPVASPSPTATPTAGPTATPSATDVAFNLPATPLASATPSSTAPLFGINTTKPTPTAAPSATPIASATPTAPPPESGENHALFFDGKLAHVATPISWLPVSGPMTIELTVWPADPASWESYPAAIAGNRHGDNFAIEARPTGIAVCCIGRNAKGTQALNVYSPQPMAGCLRIASVIDQQQVHLFIDGKLVATGAIPGTLEAHERSIMLGGEVKGVDKDANEAEWFFHGTIDEVRISKGARHVKDYTPTERLVTDEDTVALYHFNEGAGTVLYDYSGNQHHGTIVGAQWVKAPPLDSRIVPPDSSTLIRVLAEVDKAIQPDVVKAKTPLDKGALAQRLLTDSADAAKPTENRFALAQRALDFAVESGDRTLIDLVLADHEAKFQGSADERLVDVLSAVAKRTLTQPVWQTLAAVAYERWSRGYAEDRLGLARRYADAFTIIARKANNPAVTKAATDLTKRLGTLKSSLDTAVAAQEKLAADASDADAHLTLGQYLCFDKEDWFPGLEHLTKGTDEALRALAEQSLAAGDDLAKTLAAADAWYDASVKATGRTKPQYQAAAVFWYLEAYNRLTDTDRKRVEGRLTQLGAKTKPMSFTQARREFEAAKWAIESGGSAGIVLEADKVELSVDTVANLPSQPFWCISLKLGGVTPVPNAAMRVFSQLRQLRDFFLDDRYFEAGGSDLMCRATTIHTLRFRNVTVRDDDLKNFQRLTYLSSLSLFNCDSFTDSGLRHLATLNNLSNIDITSSGKGATRMTPGTAAALAQIKSLATLSLNGYGLTDDGLRELVKAAKLTSLNVGGTKVTPAAVQQFRAAMPRCVITGP